jgi:hypothetical protein
MGSKPNDSGTMKSASAGAQAADQQLAGNAKQNQDFLNAARLKTLGSAADGFTGGTLSKFLDPHSLDVSGPTGTYGLQYNKAVENIANQSKNARGSLSRYMASRGFGNTPAGFGADLSRRQESDQVDQQGAAFTDYAGKSYQDSLQNFWRATGTLNGEGDAALSASIAGDSAAAGNYANLYGSASQPRPSPWGSIIGGGLQAGGQVGAAAMCPCEDSRILMHDGTEKMVQELRKGMDLRGIDGRPCPLLEDPRVVVREAVKVGTLEGSTKVSADHTFALPYGGYEFAFKSRALNVRVNEEIATVLEVEELGPQTVYVLEIGGSHSYRADGFWALS